MIVGQARLAGDQEQYSGALGERLGQAMIEPGMGALERVAVEVEGEVGLDDTFGELAVP